MTDTYGYLGVEPSAYLGLRLEGNAVLSYTSEWKKLIDTLAYPGLSIKGIATVGPSLDIYGRVSNILRSSTPGSRVLTSIILLCPTLIIPTMNRELTIP